MLKENTTLAVIGLGYVGLPLAVAFSKKGYNTIGFDINQERVEQLKQGNDSTLEVENLLDLNNQNLYFTTSLDAIKNATVYIVTVPTPIDSSKQPNLKPLASACKTVGSILKSNNIIIFESTVYPGCTEEYCVPILEKESNLVFNKDFFCGYSPERINPGDKKHRIHNIKKVTSGSTPAIATKVDALYNAIVEVGTHKASSIKVAEAAKVIENAQRDINIAFINELALIFEKLQIDTHEVLEAAGTKWNFLPFKPGLVGGHCIGVDPYYLTHKAKQVGINPEIILAGRSINDTMGKKISERVVKLMVKNDKKINGATVTIFGITFKENCPDIRNTKVIDIVSELNEYGINVEVFDDNVSSKEVKSTYNIDLVSKPNKNAEAVILAVAHDSFKNIDFTPFIENNAVIFDVKNFLDKKIVTDRL